MQVDDDPSADDDHSHHKILTNFAGLLFIVRTSYCSLYLALFFWQTVATLSEEGNYLPLLR